MTAVGVETKRVLVFSKATRTGRAICRRLALAGHDPFARQSTEEILAHASRQGVEAVIYHIQSPKVDAVAFLEQLRTRESDACVILVGPDPGSERTAAFLRAGAYDYLITPVPPGRLEEALREGLRVRKSFLQVRELSGKLQASNEELARERDSLKQWNRSLVLMNELSQAFAGTLDADEVIRMVGDRLAQILNIDLIGLLWLRPKRVWIHASASLDKGLVEQVRQSLLETGDGPGPTFKPAIDVKTSSQGRGRTSRSTVTLRHRLLVWPIETIEVPLMVAKDQLGLIRLLRTNGEPFDAYQVELMKAVMTSLALALRNAEAHSQLQSLAMTDGLTNLLNRRAFSNILTREFREADRYRTPLCLIMADLDHFKLVNDQFGHLAGDRLLKGVAALIGQEIRSVDVVTRYGGEEFAIILPRTDVTQALILANRIRETIERRGFAVNGTVASCTISIGIAQIPDPRVRTADEFVAMADALLYQAKARGRNRVETSQEAVKPLSNATLYAEGMLA